MKRNIACLLVAVLGMASTVWAQDSVGDMYIDPPTMDDATLQPGTTIPTMVEFTIFADDMVAINAMAFSVSFDPTVLQFAFMTQGTYFENETPLIIANQETSPGLYDFVGAVGGVYKTGSFSLVRLTFFVIGTGTTDITLGDGIGGGADPTEPSFVGPSSIIIGPASVTNATFSNDGSVPPPVDPPGGGGVPPSGGGGGDSGGGGCSASERANGAVAGSFLVLVLFGIRRTLA